VGGGVYVHLSPEHLLGEGVSTPKTNVPPCMGGGPDPPTPRATRWGGVRISSPPPGR
jgi:hypothetical protein